MTKAQLKKIMKPITMKCNIINSNMETLEEYRDTDTWTNIMESHDGNMQLAYLDIFTDVQTAYNTIFTYTSECIEEYSKIVDKYPTAKEEYGADLQECMEMILGTQIMAQKIRNFVVQCIYNMMASEEINSGNKENAQE